MALKNETYYIINFRDPKDGKPVSLKAKNVADSKLGLSFISISNFIFNENPNFVNPTEENLKKTYLNVKALHISIYSVISIEEVGADNKGLELKSDRSNLIMLTSGHPPPTN